MAIPKDLTLQIIELIKKGYSTAEIARKLNCSAPTVSYHRKKSGFELSKRPIFDFNKIQKFYDNNHTLNETCEEFKTCKRTLERAVQQGKFRLRTHSEANKLYHLLNPGVQKHTEETKTKLSKIRKEYLNKNPEKHPQRILSKNRKNWTYPEKLFAKKLDEIGYEHLVDYEHNKRILTYYPDFLFYKQMLIIEIDGEWFHKDKEKDLIRQTKLEDAGYTVIRFTATEINKNVDKCILETLKYII